MTESELRRLLDEVVRAAARSILPPPPCACSTLCAPPRSKTSDSRVSIRTASCDKGSRKSSSALARRRPRSPPSPTHRRQRPVAARDPSPAEAFDAVARVVPAAEYHAGRRTITFREERAAPGLGTVLIACRGTSDLPVAEEAAVTADTGQHRRLGYLRLGVAGLHRPDEASRARLQRARVLIVVAGMEGALRA